MCRSPMAASRPSPSASCASAPQSGKILYQRKRPDSGTVMSANDTMQMTRLMMATTGTGTGKADGW